LIDAFNYQITAITQLPDYRIKRAGSSRSDLITGT